MKRIRKIFFVALMCCVSSVASAYNPALEDESRWIFYDSDKEGVMRFDKESITLEGDRYGYVWAKKIYNTPELLGKEDLQLMYIDCEKKKYKILDYIFYNNKDTVASGARYNVLTGTNAVPWKDEYIEKKANKKLVELIFDKKQKALLVEEDRTQADISCEHERKWDYIADLSTNVWQYIGGRNLLDDATGLGESYVFYYDKQKLAVSEDGKEVTAWIKYRFIDAKAVDKNQVPVQYALSKTTINFANATYTDHLMLTYDENGKFEKEFSGELNTARPIYAGTIMDMIAQALNK